MNKFLEIPLKDNDFALIRPCARGSLSLLEYLLKKAHTQWLHSTAPAEGYETLSKECLVTLNKILLLFPRVDSDEWLDVEQLEESTLVKLCITRIDENGGYAPCDLITLQQYEPCPPSKDIPPLEKEMTVDNIPMASSGDPAMDLLGTLLCLTQGDPIGAQYMMETWDAETIDKALFAYNERQRDPEERLAEYRKKEFERIKQERALEIRKLHFGF